MTHSLTARPAVGCRCVARWTAGLLISAVLAACSSASDPPASPTAAPVATAAVAATATATPLPTPSVAIGSQPPTSGGVLLDVRVADQPVKVVRTPSGDQLCIRVETIGKDVERCIPREENGSAVDRFWFAGEVAHGYWVVLLATMDADPYWKLARIKSTTVDGQSYEADAVGDNTVVFLSVKGELDTTYIWNTSGTLVWETWPSYDRYW